MLGGEAAKTKTTRRRRSAKKKDEGTADTHAPKAAKAKAVKADAPVKEAGETKGDEVPQE
jgi:hypothetical protein